jgi:hypothetical protein
MPSGAWLFTETSAARLTTGRPKDARGAGDDQRVEADDVRDVKKDFSDVVGFDEAEAAIRLVELHLPCVASLLRTYLKIADCCRSDINVE